MSGTDRYALIIMVDGIEYEARTKERMTEEEVELALEELASREHLGHVKLKNGNYLALPKNVYSRAHLIARKL